MIERFTVEKHFMQLRRWLGHRGMNLSSPDTLGDFGLVVDGVAIGFLFKTASKQCWFDNFAADPEANPEARSEALNELFGALEDEARRDGFKVIHACSDVVAMQKRLSNLGFEPYNGIPFFKRI